MTKVLSKNNGQTFLTYYVEDEDSLNNLVKFVGDDDSIIDKTEGKLLNTLVGWRAVRVGDYVVHVTSINNEPCEIQTNNLSTYYDTGFLVMDSYIFNQFFTVGGSN